MKILMSYEKFGKSPRNSSGVDERKRGKAWPRS